MMGLSISGRFTFKKRLKKREQCFENSAQCGEISSGNALETPLKKNESDIALDTTLYQEVYNVTVKTR